MQRSSSCDPVQLLKEHSSKLVTCLTFDPTWVAREMNSEGLLDDSDCDQITSPNKPHLSKLEMAALMMDSLSKKVSLSPKYLKKMIALLKINLKMYPEAIEILEEICLNSSAKLDGIETSATELTNEASGNRGGGTGGHNITYVDTPDKGQMRQMKEEITYLQQQLQELIEARDGMIQERTGEIEKCTLQIPQLLELLEAKNQEIESLTEELHRYHAHMSSCQGQSLFSADDYYVMNRMPHGYCLIFNNCEFHHPHDPNKARPNRSSASIDSSHLTLAFKYLCYEVVVKDNLKAIEMQDTMLEFATRDHSNYDSFVCCILTHGDDNVVYGADSLEVNFYELASTMKLSLTLRGKPKIFFVQASRGDREMIGLDIMKEAPGKITSGESMEVSSGFGQRSLYSDNQQVSQSTQTTPGCSAEGNFDHTPNTTASNSPPITATLPQGADYFFGFATLPGNAAYRSRKHGSWFVTKLCEILVNNAYNDNLSCMMKKVNRKLSDAYTKEGYKQCTESVDRLRKTVHFFRFIK